MTDSDERPIPASCATWLAAHPEWAPVPEFAKSYEASHRGNGVRSVDRVSGGRRLRGVVLKASPNNDGYPMANMTRDDGAVKRPTIHSCVMLAHAGPRPPGLEIRHLNNDPADSRYCGCGSPECTEGNMAYGTKKEQHADQVAAGTAVVPESFECVYHARCGGRVKNPGRRCEPCRKQIGQFGAMLLDAGMPSLEVAGRFGYTDGKWMAGLAIDHGGYGGARALTDKEYRARLIVEARTQRPTLVQRARILGILRLARRAGLLRGDAA